LEDRELVRRLLAKDEQAYRHLYQTYRGRLYRACVFILGYRDPDAEDVTQEVFLAALQKLHQFQFRSSLYHWMHCIATYLCYKRIRARKRLVVKMDEEFEAMVESAMPSRFGQEQEEREKQKLIELIQAQKALLGEPCRGLLELRDVQKKSYAELAEILKVPIGTVNSRLARCKGTLKDLVERALKGGRRG
jgi:RNA polymerase sigma-70 factor, ECF subfamily